MGAGLAGEGDAIDGTRPDLPRLAARIVAAYASRNAVSPPDLLKLLGSAHQALSTLDTPAAPIERLPAVPVRKSLRRDSIVCLECGLRFKSLKRHLQSSHGLNPEGYRQTWRLSPDYPMVAPEYAERRSALARKSGLGRKRSRSKGKRSKA